MFVLCAGYASGGGGGGDYNRGRRGQDESTDSGQSRGRSDRSSGGDDSGMETQRDTVFIQNLPRNITEDQLNEVFKQIGMIKVRNDIFFSSTSDDFSSCGVERSEDWSTENMDL